MVKALPPLRRPRFRGYRVDTGCKLQDASDNTEACDLISSQIALIVRIAFIAFVKPES